MCSRVKEFYLIFSYCGSPYDLGVNIRSSEMDFASINYGYSTFDNIFLAVYTLFQVLTQEGWSSLIYILSETSNTIITYLYFVLFILISGFFA